MIEKKALDVVVMDIRKLTDITDFFVIATAESNTHLRAVADALLDGFAKIGLKPYRTEGWKGGQWIIVDFVEVVVHIFHRDAREFYKIERLWSDAKTERIADAHATPEPTS
jgi:ribosome-associated protein